MRAFLAQGLRHGIDAGGSEIETFWTELLRSLKDRNLTGVHLAVSGPHSALKAINPECVQGTGWQRCRVHAMRNLLAVANKQRQIVGALIRAVFAQPGPNDAPDQLRR